MTVTGIFDKPKKKEVDNSEMSFEEIMQKNKENAERVKKEKAKANKRLSRDLRRKRGK